MNILLLGGTRFVGRHIAEAALQRGHQVSTFTRGTNPLPGTESLVGDRKKGDLGALEGRTWDAVVDVNGYLPREVREAVGVLQGQVGRYAFISTVSVYRESAAPLDENAPLQTLADPTVEEVTPETYGGLKVLCELEVERAFGERSLVVRPHLVVGPRDPTDRFTYWPRRFAGGGRVLVPGKPENTLQFVDARDLGQFVILGLEKGLSGAYNAASTPVTWGHLVKACQQATANPAEAVWADEQWLLDNQVTPWADLPAWIPSFAPGRGLGQIQNARAQAAGFSMRPLEQTVQDTLAWDKTRSESLRAGMSREREFELLQLLV
ncbi:NAD-dependent epimerase/dehydratase family protein [Meiothermus sp.]|uniref:NAD-dependent epimerase/dehydratase family protein n=1 Tax=Meiothermus sp. TaxID=1955249 RepID=UPI00307EC7C3